MITSQ